MDRKKYQQEYFQNKKEDTSWYDNKRMANMEWNKTHEGRIWRRKYMREYYEKHSVKINENRRIAYNSRTKKDSK